MPTSDFTSGVKIDIQPASFPWMDPSRYAFCLGMEAGPAVWLSGHTAARYEAERNVVRIESIREVRFVAVQYEPISPCP